ncbi:conserved exported hypothetical protein [Vibrio nigripulchritudo MADA3029]|uniref:DUF5992 family protein n=1 Tax=Vibrio nigripulchritudo TaxID=28173 RepID=UPI00021C2000|nr:DUF5992 family protein [Vibrio nigripulchritudo]EGU50952.1 hypothetical protein VINI7043_11561 [Vibrio nigripulchritudo ATCC 27043]CCN48531.1 conserved exported hypothetical protein [Vibrio nigripulchritudo MADA3020]CCN55601.1 conserved exported hypothetical protein [Vibrio nigripulchritudo MADA3021]CCN60738.1 conserved exported hypothetical protein [Vibrio nigripulchritudo MADA3029]CCN72822.1 conserved exported hypothetical protein [Vibrio nigripulchritudo SFn118]
MKKLITIALFVFASSANGAGTYIVKDATITSVANTSGNGDNFTVWVEGGTGVCANKSINFPRTATSSNEIFSRAYSTALTAFASGHKVWIHDYAGASCTNAAYIRVIK